MKATVYYDDEDLAIDPLVAKRHFAEQLNRWGLRDMEIVMRPDKRMRLRRPLLCIDGGKLGA